jgi:hypothetical protein
VATPRREDLGQLLEQPPDEDDDDRMLDADN